MNPETVMLIDPARLVGRLEEDARERVLQALAASLVDRERPALLGALKVVLDVARADLPELEQTAREAAEAVARQESTVAELAAIAPHEATWLRPEDEAAAEALRDARSELGALKAHAAYTSARVRDKLGEARALLDRISVVEAMPAPDAAVLEVLFGRKK